MNTNLNYNEAINLIFGAEKRQEMKARSERAAARENEAWKKEIAAVINNYEEEEENDIMTYESGKEEEMTTIEVKTMVNRFRAKNKEAATKWIGAIKNNKSEYFKTDVVNITLDDLAAEIMNGKAIIPAVLDGRLEDVNFKEQQLFALDIDYIGTSLYDLKNKLKDYPYAMIYTSFSHTEAIPKYRVLFVADKVITDAQEARQITASLMQVAGCADDKCVDVSRVFFAGRSVVEIHDRTFSVDKLLANTTVAYQDVLPTVIKKEKIAIIGREEEGKENLTITEDEVIANLSQIRDFEGMELDYEGSFNWINQNIDLAVALGKKENVLFRCLHPDHVDNKPSAMVYKYGNKYHYRCNCSAFNNPKSVIDVLAELLDMDKVEVQYLITDALSITMGSAYQRNARLLIADVKANITKMIKPDTILYKEMKFLWGALNTIQDFASAKVTVRPLSINSKRPTFFMTRNQLAAEMQRLDIKGSSIRSVQNKLEQLKDLGFIRPLKDEEITETYLAEANEIRKKQVVLTGRKFLNRTEYYELCAITPAMIRKAEKNITLRKELGAKKKHMNVTRRANTYGVEHAKAVNVQGQVEKKTTDNKHKKEYEKIILAAQKLINDQGYFTEEQLRKEYDPKRKKKKSIAEKLINDSIPIVIKTLGIEKNRAKNSTRKLYSIPSTIKTNTTIYC